MARSGRVRSNHSRRCNVRRWQHGKSWSWTNRTNRAPGWSEGQHPGLPIEVWKGTTNWAKEAQDCGWTFALPGEPWLKSFPGLLKHEDKAQENGSTSTFPEEPWQKSFPGLLKHEDKAQESGWTSTFPEEPWQKSLPGLKHEDKAQESGWTSTFPEEPWQKSLTGLKHEDKAQESGWTSTFPEEPWQKSFPGLLKHEDKAQESGWTSTFTEERPWLEDFPELKYEDEASDNSEGTVEPDEEPEAPVKVDACPIAPEAKEADSDQMATAPPPKATIPAGWAWHFLQEVQGALRTEGVSNFENFTPEDTEKFLTRWKDRLNLGDISQLRHDVHGVHPAPWQLVPCPEKRGAKRQHSSDLPDAKRARPMITQLAPQQDSFREQDCYQILEVDEVFFSQRKMSRRFKDGRYVDELLDDLWQGRVHPLDEFLHLDVVERPYSGKYRFFSNHNRRLWCLKQHKLNLGGEEVYVRCKIVSIETLRQVRTNHRHFDTRNGGQSIKLRD